MLTDMKSLLVRADAEGYGLPAPNAYDADSIRSCFESALQTRSPLVISIAERLDLEYLAEVARFFAVRHPEVPVSVALDHGRSFESVCKAIRVGFNAVMFDRSEESLEVNVKETCEIVRMAHASGVSVEAEIGHVGREGDHALDRGDRLTQVDEAVEFVDRTGVDCLAIAIGTVHGRYKEAPRLDYERLASIRSAVSVPLVLHGGSYTGDDNLVKAVRLGIAKVNLAHELSQNGVDALRTFLSTRRGRSDPRMHEIMEAARDGFRAKLTYYMRLLGTENRW